MDPPWLAEELFPEGTCLWREDKSRRVQLERSVFNASPVTEDELLSIMDKFFTRASIALNFGWVSFNDVCYFTSVLTAINSNAVTMRTPSGNRLIKLRTSNQ